MSKKLLSLSDRSITDTGEVVFSYDALLKLARDGVDVSDFIADNDELVEKYNKYSQSKLSIFEEGDIELINEDLYNWNTPEEYTILDIDIYCATKLADFNLTSGEYIDRLSYELDEMQKRNMTPLIKHLIYLIDHFRKNEVVWGVGRGSSCASLVLYLIGLNAIDPIKYEIPIDEFLR